jgi:Helix-turn-helix
VPSDGPGLPGGLTVGAAITFLRRRAGMPQRELTRRLGLSARSNLSDYELGRRVPPQDIVLACETIFGLRGAELQRLRQQMLGERALAAAQDPPGDGDQGAKGLPGQEPAAVGPAETSGATGSPELAVGTGDRGRSRRVGVIAVAATALALLVGAGVLLMEFRGGPGGPGSHVADGSAAAGAAATRGATARPVRSTFRELAHHDGDDPAVTGCSQDVVTRAVAVVYLPGGAVFGRLLLRHSPGCEMSWGAVWGPDPHLYRVYITAQRPRDHAAESSSWAANTPPGSYGNMLSTAAGCVQVSAYVKTPAGNGPTATTRCLA